MVIKYLANDKKEKAPPVNPPVSHYPNMPKENVPQKPVTFQDVLRELERRVEPESSETIPQGTRDLETEYKPLEDFRPDNKSLEEEAPKYKSLEQEYLDQDIRRKYQESVSEASKVKTLDEAVSLDIKKRLVSETEEEKQVNEYALRMRRMLSNPEGAKQAVILTEILNKKY